MSITATIRAKEWWEHKIPPIMAMAYGTAALQKKTMADIALHLLFLIVALIIGASFVSIVNNITDIKADFDCGKPNYMGKVSKLKQGLLVLMCIFPGLFICYLMRQDIVSVVFYVSSWVMFTLYSVPPFRLKNRKVAGIMADAAGSQMFPSLLVVSSISFYTGNGINMAWVASIGIWSLIYGIRGILLHQFTDRENDLASGMQSFAASVALNTFKTKSHIIMGIELMAFFLILIQLDSLLCYFSLGFYLLFILIRAIVDKSLIVAVLPPANGYFQFLMGDFYQVLFPMVLLVGAAIVYPFDWVFVIVHLLFFPKGILLFFSDSFRFIKISITKNIINRY